MRAHLLALSAAALLLNQGCLIKETSNTIYLEASGRATWTVLEQNIRSDKDVPAAALLEEQEYMTLVRTEAHPLARAFRQLRATDLRVRRLRDRRPYTVETTATFFSVAVLFKCVMNELQLPSVSWIETRGDVTIWTLVIGPTAFWDDDEMGKRLEPLAPLGDGDFRFMLEEGRFVLAEGFTISSNGSVAMFLEDGNEDADDDKAGKEDEAPSMLDRLRSGDRVTLRLGWTNGAARP